MEWNSLHCVPCYSSVPWLGCFLRCSVTKCLSVFFGFCFSVQLLFSCYYRGWSKENHHLRLQKVFKNFIFASSVRTSFALSRTFVSGFSFVDVVTPNLANQNKRRQILNQSPDSAGKCAGRIRLPLVGSGISVRLVLIGHLVFTCWYISLKKKFRDSAQVLWREHKEPISLSHRPTCSSVITD